MVLVQVVQVLEQVQVLELELVQVQVLVPVRARVVVVEADVEHLCMHHQTFGAAAQRLLQAPGLWREGRRCVPVPS